jgi:hypothetical protein
MLRSMQDLENYAIRATDGIIGHVKDLYFDDGSWVVRYLVIETGRWLASRKVLISPMAIGQPDWIGKVLPASITKQQVKMSPDIDTNKPVSRQHERQYLEYYGFPSYWDGGGLWGPGAYPAEMLSIGYGGVSPGYALRMAETNRAEAENHSVGDGDPHLRSCKALTSYRIEATDGGVGHVQGLLVDEETWAIRDLVVETSSWWLGHQVIIAPQSIRDINWLDSTVSIALNRQAVKDAPPYESASPPNRNQETARYQHHGRTRYWADQVNLENPQYRVVGSAPSGAAQADAASARLRT